MPAFHDRSRSHQAHNFDREHYTKHSPKSELRGINMAEYRKGSGSPSEKHSPSEEGQRQPFQYQQYDTHAVDDPNRLSDPTDVHHSLHRGLSARQISMIAIGTYSCWTARGDLYLPSQSRRRNRNRTHYWYRSRSCECWSGVYPYLLLDHRPSLLRGHVWAR